MPHQKENRFQEYALSEEILTVLSMLGYQQPTDIQAAVIPVMLDGRHVTAKAPTGSGKTAAFAIPICEMVSWDEKAPQALILEPTRELAVQVSDEVFHIGRKKRLKVPAVFGGFPIDKQIQTLRQRAHIVVGTPGRVIDLIRRESLSLDKIDYLVIDEADLMLDMGFVDEIKAILTLLPAHCKISLFSATLKPEIRAIVDTYVNDSVLIMQDSEEVTGRITQKLYQTGEDRKYEDFISVLIDENPVCCIIFCGTREMTGVLFQKLRRNRIFCGMIHGEMEQRDRLKTIESFRRGGFRYLIATDVAARGIDFEDLTHVINYDFPTGRETYVHRIGRVGRNGKAGTAISLLCEDERRMLSQVEAYMETELPVSPAPPRETLDEKAFWKSQRIRAELKPRKGESLNRGIMRLSIGGGRKSKIRAVDIVGTVCSIDGLTAADIGIIDVRESLTYVEILNGKGDQVLESLQTKTLKGKIRKIRKTR